jgi:hypothetical protein
MSDTVCRDCNSAWAPIRGALRRPQSTPISGRRICPSQVNGRQRLPLGCFQSSASTLTTISSCTFFAPATIRRGNPSTSSHRSGWNSSIVNRRCGFGYGTVPIRFWIFDNIADAAAEGISLGPISPHVANTNQAGHHTLFRAAVTSFFRRRVMASEVSEVSNRGPEQGRD